MRRSVAAAVDRSLWPTVRPTMMCALAPRAVPHYADWRADARQGGVQESAAVGRPMAAAVGDLRHARS